MIARVRGVIAASILAASMFAVSSSTSTNTGFAPISAIISAVAAKVNGVVTTSSPGFTSSASSAISSASVPEATATQCLAPVQAASRSSSSFDFRPHDVLAVVEHALDARVDALAQRGVLRLQVDEIQRAPAAQSNFSAPASGTPRRSLSVITGSPASGQGMASAGSFQSSVRSCSGA